jgi:hypothetical protein
MYPHIGVTAVTGWLEHRRNQAELIRKINVFCLIVMGSFIFKVNVVLTNIRFVGFLPGDSVFFQNTLTMFT